MFILSLLHAGTYCPVGTTLALNCTGGTYTNASMQSSCVDCPVGFYCVVGSDGPVECPRGHYCPANTQLAEENPCTNGTFNPNTQGETESNCQQCSPGKYCPWEGESSIA